MQLRLQWLTFTKGEYFMVSRLVYVQYTFRNTGNMPWTFWTWVYIYQQENWANKINFELSSVSLNPGQEMITRTLSKTVNLVTGTYRAVAAVYSDSARTSKLSDLESGDIIIV